MICIDNSDYLASLGLHKIYTALPDERAAQDDYLRVVDESGEDYLYSAKRFVPVELPLQVKRSVIRSVRESTVLANLTSRRSRRAARHVNPYRTVIPAGLAAERQSRYAHKG